MVVKHKFVSQKADSLNPTLVNPSNWNEEHVVIGGDFPGPSEYNFTPQCFNIPLTAGVAASITLAPVPLGLNGSDIGHYIYISGGTGAAESVLITGGSAVSGASSGTIIFTPANAHTGTWCISSASGGIQEAINENEAVYIPTGITDIYGTINLPCNVQISGAGNTVSILKAQKSNLIFFTNVNKDQGESGCTHKWNISDLVLDGELFESNTMRGFEVIDIHLGGYYQTGAFLNFRNIVFYNVKQAFYMDRVMNVQIRNIRSTDNTTAWFGSTQGLTDGRSYSIIIDGWLHNPVDRPLPFIPKSLTAADALITFRYCLNSRIVNFITQSALRATGIRLEGLCEECTIENTTIIAASTGVELINGTGTEGPNWTRIINSHIDNLSVAGIDIKGNCNYSTIADNEISNNNGVDGAEGIRISGLTQGFLIHGNIFQNFGSGTGSTNTRVVRVSNGTNIQIDGNLFVNNTPNARNIRIEGTAVRYTIINNIFWTGGGPTTDPIDDAVGDGWALIANNRFNENDTLKWENVNITRRVNRQNISEEIGNIDGTAGSHITDRHTSGFNTDGDFRITYSGGTAIAWNGDITYQGRLVIFNTKAIQLPIFLFADMPAASLSLGALVFCRDGLKGSDPLVGGGNGALAISDSVKWRGV